MELEPLLSMEWEQKLLLKKCLLNWKRSYVYRKIRIIGKKSARKVRAQFVVLPVIGRKYTSCFATVLLQDQAEGENIYKLFCYCTAPRSRGRWKYIQVVLLLYCSKIKTKMNIYKMFSCCTAPRSRGRWKYIQVVLLLYCSKIKRKMKIYTRCFTTVLLQDQEEDDEYHLEPDSYLHPDNQRCVISDIEDQVSKFHEQVLDVLYLV